MQINNIVTGTNSSQRTTDGRSHKSKDKFTSYWMYRHYFPKCESRSSQSGFGL